VKEISHENWQKIEPALLLYLPQLYRQNIGDEEIARQQLLKNFRDKRNLSLKKESNDECVIICWHHESGIYAEMVIPKNLVVGELQNIHLLTILHKLTKELISDLKKIPHKSSEPEEKSGSAGSES